MDFTVKSSESTLLTVDNGSGGREVREVGVKNITIFKSERKESLMRLKKNKGTNRLFI